MKKYLSDHVDAEVQTLEVGHGEEGGGHDLTDQVPAQVQIFERFQMLQITLFDRLELKYHILA